MPTANRRRLPAALAVLGLAAVLTAIPGTAQAATYDGQDPVASGCASGATVAEQHPITDVAGTTVGWVQLRYSRACRTVWGRVLTASSAWAYGDVSVTRNSDGAMEFSSVVATTIGWSSAVGAYVAYTPMLNDAGVTSYATGCLYNRALSEEDCWDTASY